MSSLWPVSGDAEGILALLQEWDASAEARPLVIETSGSTGNPKRVVLSRGALRASADATHRRLGGPGRWELNLPPTYVAGVQVLFRTVRAAGAVDRSYISLVPTQLVRAMQDGFDVHDLGRYDAVLVGGGPLSPEVRAEAESMQIRVVQTYGMSETCGGCVYDGVPLDGVEVRIDGDDQVLVRGPVLFDGYEGEPERTAAAFRDGWLVTNDLGHWAEDGRLAIDGRADDVIISGGVKVPPLAVEQMLEQHPDVAYAFVFGVPDPEWGEQVTSLLVVDGWVPPIEELRDLVTPRSWAPRAAYGIPDVPLLANGKPDRVTLKRMLLDGR